MRRLSFADSRGVVRFDVIYGGLVTSERGFSGLKEVRAVSRILDKLEAIGKPIAQPSGIVQYELNTLLTSMEVLLEETEFSLVQDTLLQAKWTAIGARKAVPTIDWLASIEEVPVAPTTDR